MTATFIGEHGVEGTWMEGDVSELPISEIYLASVYFTVTTITTVGYGDFSGGSKSEQIFCIFIMLVGVMTFSFFSGSLASIIQFYDCENAKYREQLSLLNKLFKEYKLPVKLYANLKQSINYQASNDFEKIHEFTEELPHKLRVELSVYLYRDLYSRLFFLQDKSSSFLAWICPLFKPMMFGINQYIYFEGDDVNCIFFLKKGSMGFVLPKHSNFKFVDIGHGNTFGVVDIISSMLRHEEIEADQWFIRKDLLKR
jgi:potassium voltage-gated channel Eag-related subfamily H member 8